MEGPFSRIPGFFPKTLPEKQNQKFFKKPIDKSGKCAIIQKLSDRDEQKPNTWGYSSAGSAVQACNSTPTKTKYSLSSTWGYSSAGSLRNEKYAPNEQPTIDNFIPRTL